MSASLARVHQLSTGHRQRPEFSPHQSDAYSDSLRHRSRGRRQVASSSWAMAASSAPGNTFAWKTPRPAPAHLLATHLWSLSHLHRPAPARWLTPARGAAAPAPVSQPRATAKRILTISPYSNTNLCLTFYHNYFTSQLFLLLSSSQLRARDCEL